MSSNVQKIPFVRSMNEFVERKIRSALEALGKSLPAEVVAVDNSIVTVKFLLTYPLLPQIQVPIATSQYRREPTQVGDLGVVRASDVRIGIVTGLGGGTPDLTVPGNLSALVWEPVANLNWSATDDPDAYLIYGPNGFILRDTGKNCTVTGDTTQITIEGKTQVQVKVGSSTITITSSGIDIKGTLTINGDPYLAHTHSGVTTGGGVTGPVV